MMRIIPVQTLLPELTEAQTPYDYQLLADDADGSMEDYGFSVSHPDSGERAEVKHVTPNPAHALFILGLLARNQVSPIHLLDVVEDYLAAQD